MRNNDKNSERHTDELEPLQGNKSRERQQFTYLNKPEHSVVLSSEVMGPVPCMGSQRCLRALCWAWEWEEGFQCSLNQGTLEMSAG